MPESYRDPHSGALKFIPTKQEKIIKDVTEKLREDEETIRKRIEELDIKLTQADSRLQEITNLYEELKELKEGN